MLHDVPPGGVPTDPPERLRALRSLGGLESGCDLLLESVVHRAAILFNVPIATVRLHDGARQAAKSWIGFGVPFTADDLAFCGEAIDSHQPAFLLDAQADPRFAGNSLIQGWPGIRFYASAPVLGPERQLLGAVCVMDRRARAQATPEELAGLKALAAEAAAAFTAAPMEAKPERGW